MKIDVHAHLLPVAELDAPLPPGMSLIDDGSGKDVHVAVESRGRTRSFPVALRDPAAHVALQAERGVSTSLVSPWMHAIKAASGAAEQTTWSTVLNDAVLRAVKGVPQLRAVSALPEDDGDAAADELARTVALGAVGGVIASNLDVGTLGDPRFDQLWQASVELQAPIVLHPGEFAAQGRMSEDFLSNMVGNPFETTLAVVALILADVPERFPDLKLVLCHGGGMYPLQYGRMATAIRRRGPEWEKKAQAPKGLLKWFYYDTVLFDRGPTEYLINTVGADHVLAGTDCPFSMSDPRPFVDAEQAGLAPEHTEAVLGGNARRIFHLDS